MTILAKEMRIRVKNGHFFATNIILTENSKYFHNRLNSVNYETVDKKLSMHCPISIIIYSSDHN